MVTSSTPIPRQAWSVLIVSTLPFTVCFMVWMMFGVIGIPLKKSLGLNATDIDGFSLHAAVRCGADDRQALEQLCRYITRPPCRPHRASGPVPRQAQTVHWTVCVRDQHWPASAYKPTPLARSC
jgi:hypothetical protein